MRGLVRGFHHAPGKNSLLSSEAEKNLADLRLSDVTHRHTKLCLSVCVGQECERSLREKTKSRLLLVWRLSEKKPSSEYLYPRSCCCWKFFSNLSYTGFWMIQQLWTTSQRTQDHWCSITYLDFQGIWVKGLFWTFHSSPGHRRRRNRNSAIWI